MTVVRLERRLGALEAKKPYAYQNLDHLSDADLEAMIEKLRGDVLDTLNQECVQFPDDWCTMTQTHQDRWAEAKLKELLVAEEARLANDAAVQSR